jgi:hypothetical protein
MLRLYSEKLPLGSNNVINKKLRLIGVLLPLMPELNSNDSILLLTRHNFLGRLLGIEHRSFVKTIDRYQEQITSITDKPEDQVLRFEISKPLDSSKGGRPERFVYLTDAQASFVMTLSRNTPQVVECKRQLVAAFEKAKQVIKEVIPAQAQEIERLKLELELARARDSAARSEDFAARSQERLMQVSQAIATLHGAGMLGLILGKPEAVVEAPPTIIEKTILVNQSGRPVKTYLGLSKTKLAKRYGFKKPQDLVNWLHSIGKVELIQPGITATPCQFVPFEYVPELDHLWASRQGSRQRLLGE